MERKGEASNAWRPMEREGEASNVWRPMEGEDKASFVPLSTPPQATYLRLCLFPLISWFYITIVLAHYLHITSYFPWPINYDRAF